MRFRFLICFFISSFTFGQDTLNTEIVSDSIGNEIFLVKNEKGQPLHFFSPVFTPVCVDGSCYPINIIIYWNLAGDYAKYELPKDEILTKIEHLPFTDFDYGLLHRMIQKSPSALSDFSIYELTTDDKKSKVDGVTGATRPELSGSFVPDALYTTYTLWHLVRRPSQALLSYTKENYFNKEWESYLMEHPKLGCTNKLVSYFVKGSTSENKLAQLIRLINTYPNSFPYETLQEINNLDYSLQVPRSQLSNWYSSGDNDELKIEILQIWKQIKITEEEFSILVSSIGKSSACFEDELKLIDEFNPWPNEEYELFYIKAKDQRNMMRREKMMTVLRKRSESYPKNFKKLLKKDS